MTGVLRRFDPRRFDLRYAAAVAVLLAVALGLRLWGVGSGLPWVYNVDEAQHFVPLAVGMQGGNLDPGGYFANPPAFTYLLAGLFRLWLGGRTGRVYYSDHSTESVADRPRGLGRARHAGRLAAVSGRRAPV